LRAALGLLALLCAGTAQAQAAIDQRAQEVIDRTRTTRANYSLFSWNHASVKEGPVLDEWSAEFNRGNLHRVETPRDRLVADCEAHTGVHVNLQTLAVSRGLEVAKAACGVQANSKILSASYDGRGDGRFGLADRITVRDPENLRTYEVAANGAIVGATIRSEDGRVSLKMWTVALENEAPNDIFTEESLTESAVPEKYRLAPESAVGD
jgi:hypothetical protein